MSNKRNAPIGTAIPMGAEKKMTGETFTSCTEYSTPPRACQGVVALLSPGRENGRHVSDLAAALGCDNRELRRLVQAARKAGALILSDVHAGYFLPNDIDEIRRFIRSMEHRAREINAATVAAERALDAATGQERIEGWWTV